MNGLPDRVKVGPKYYKLQTSPEHWNQLCADESVGGAYGHTDNKTLVISISPYQSSSEYQDTLLHEILHAVWAQGPDIGATMDDIGQDGREEYLVGRQSPWLLLVLQDNPRLFEFLRTIEPEG